MSVNTRGRVRTTGLGGLGPCDGRKLRDTFRFILRKSFPMLAFTKDGMSEFSSTGDIQVWIQGAPGKEVVREDE